MSHRAVRGPSRFIAVVITVMCAGCGRTPAQNTDEYRREIQTHRRGRIDTWVVPDSHEAVSERLRYAFMSCFDRAFESCSWQNGHYFCHRSVYHPRAIAEGASRRTLTIQMEAVGAYGPARRAPPGGIFQLVVDVDPDAAGSRVTFYGTTHQYYDRFLLAVRRWAEAIEQPLECPSLGGDFGDLRQTEIPPASPPAPAPAALDQPPQEVQP